jgi:putative membrane protein
MREYFSVLLKGAAMGVANVIPGVSGGTIALITNIFERLIHAVKSFDIQAFRLLLSGRIRSFIKHTDLYFLIAIFAGIGLAIVSIARLFEHLFAHYPVHIWAYFFGLILASVFFVGKTIKDWRWSGVLFLVLGSALALTLTFLNPATENDGFIYLMLCGVAAMCSMILPGLSGSFILILMGNYQLVMIEAVNDLRLDILLPVALGALVGLVAFSHLLSWIFKKFRDQTIALLTGFIFGSLSILWPWKHTLYLKDASGQFVLKDGEMIITAYENFLPTTLSGEVLFALILMGAGILSIAALEISAGRIASATKKTAG